MKANKNAKKTTVSTLITSLNRWYGDSWWKGGLTILTIFLISVIIPGILG